jgi:tripartite-type tricarboxylate transporter receptor subunit TctC
MTTRRTWFSILGLAALSTALLGLATGAAAQGFPSKPVRIVVPFPPGGSTDLLARRIAEKWQQSLGQPVIVENRPGAGGVTGSDFVARAAPDGHTLVMGVTGSHGVSISLNPRLPYHPLRSFEPISRVVSAPLVIVVGAAVPARTLAEYVAAARSKPGEITHSSPGVGTSMHLTGEMFNAAAGTQLVHVPYKGSAGAINDLMGGQVQSMFSDFLVALPQVESGRIRALAVTSARRHPLMPNVPTVAESGYPGFEALSWQGLFAPAGTPREVIERLNAETQKALASPDIRDFFSRQGFEVAGSTPAEFRAFIEAEIPKWAKVVKEAGLTPP